jgi:hypothetical protein
MFPECSQEMRGNIRVYCRVRPPLPDEIAAGVKEAVMPGPDPEVSLQLLGGSQVR